MKYFLFVIVLFALIYSMMWFSSRRTYPVEFGISFNQNHATYLGFDWREVYTAMLRELKPKYIRIAAMWNDVEKNQGTFDFADVDWMMDEASLYDTKVMLVVGQKAPRWPECHIPPWIGDHDKAAGQAYLMNYIEQTVERYRTHPALELWQVENEPFITFRFGECRNFRRDLIEEEVAFVRSLDPNHKIIMTDSGELSTWRRAIHTGDLFGTTVYRIVRTPTGMIFTYGWMPPALYRFKALMYDRPLHQMFVTELQAEPWFTDTDPTNTPLSIQEKTMDPERLQRHFDYVSRIGVSRAYLWGVEWWYFMREKHGDARYWEMVRKQLDI